MKPRDLSWGEYIRRGTGRRLSQLGERLNIPALTYNPIVMSGFHECGLKDAPIVIKALCEMFPQAKRCLDVGSGSGVFAAEFQRHGAEVQSIEHSKVGIRMALKQGVDCRPFDLTLDNPAQVDGKFHLVYCFEVAEHLPSDLGAKLVSYISSFQATIVFTAAQPGQGGTGHINEQCRAYWIEKFEQNGNQYEPELTERLSVRFGESRASAWFSRNVSVFSPQHSTKE